MPRSKTKHAEPESPRPGHRRFDLRITQGPTKRTINSPSKLDSDINLVRLIRNTRFVGNTPRILDELP